MKKRSGGFTLIELVVTLVCCSLITLAAMTVLLLSIRVESGTQSAARQRQTVRVVLTALENLAGSGRVTSVEQGGEDWILLGGGNTPLLQYAAADGALISGGGTVLMDGLEDAQAEWDGETHLFSFSLQTSDGAVYTTSVYCRTDMTQTAYAGADMLLEEAERALAPGEGGTSGETAGRIALLTVLAGQYGSEGEIRNGDGEYTYYSEWYIGGYIPGWSENTPWCACFVSWGAAQVGESLRAVPRFADVDAGVEGFQDGTFGSWRGREETPVPGDFIFFNWDGDQDVDHVGAVLYADSGRGVVYTIEGNSGGKVALRVYSLSDPRIVGCGVLDWKAE